MAVTLESFRVHFPEFVDATDELITSHLTDAESITPTDVFSQEAYRDQVVKYRAADSLACSPWGRYARLTPEEGTSGRSAYASKLETLLDAAPVGGPWVPGVC